MVFHRTLAAALVTLAALAALAAIALRAGRGESPTPKPEVRTVVVRRTVHERPKHRTPAPAPLTITASSRGDDHGRDDEDHDRGGDDHRGHGGGHD